MRNYLLSPNVLAFFVGFLWDSAVGIHFHAGKMLVCPQCKTSSCTYIRVYVQLLDCCYYP